MHVGMLDGLPIHIIPRRGSPAYLISISNTRLKLWNYKSLPRQKVGLIVSLVMICTRTGHGEMFVRQTTCKHDLQIDYLLLLQSMTLIDTVRSFDTSHITGERGVVITSRVAALFISDLDNYRLIGSNGRLHALKRGRPTWFVQQRSM